MNRTTTNPSRPVRRPGRLTLAALLCGLVATTLSAAEPTGALVGRVTAAPAGAAAVTSRS